jgi:hypothetical protein
MEREKRRSERDTAEGVRTETAKQRHAATPATGLALAFAELASHLNEAEHLDGVLVRVVEAAVSTLTPCDMASVTGREKDAYRTLASTDEHAIAADQTQYSAHEGPCLDALEQAIVHAPVLPDERWPNLGTAPMAYGGRAIASYRLAAPVGAEMDALAGSLTIYAGMPEAFDDETLEIGLILAAHASIALRATHEREGLELSHMHLNEAITSRDVIGQAKGILMERQKISADEAFDILRRSSQRLNLKLREVARRLTESGVGQPTSDNESAPPKD